MIDRRGIEVGQGLSPGPDDNNDGSCSRYTACVLRPAAVLAISYVLAISMLVAQVTRNVPSQTDTDNSAKARLFIAPDYVLCRPGQRVAFGAILAEPKGTIRKPSAVRWTISPFMGMEIKGDVASLTCTESGEYTVSAEVDGQMYDADLIVWNGGPVPNPAERQGKRGPRALTGSGVPLGKTDKTFCDTIVRGMSRDSATRALRLAGITLAEEDRASSFWDISSGTVRCRVTFDASGKVKSKKKSLEN